MSESIRNNEEAEQYEMNVDGHLAYVAYEREGDDRIVFTHTIVPEEISGRGIANKLVKHALDEARAQKLKVVPQCSFVAAYMQRHEEYQDLKA